MSAINPQEFDQALAAMRDSTSRLWWAIYQGCISVGFDTNQSFNLVQTYILGQNPYGISPPRESGPRPNDDEH